MQGPLATIDRLVEATNRHDLESVAACFAEDYLNETPVHPARGFRGRAQVHRNWEQIFGAVPDIQVTVLRSAVDGATDWTEWEMRGTRRDGKPHLMGGMIVFGVDEGAIRWARFYLEPVDESTATVNEFIREQVVRQ